MKIKIFILWITGAFLMGCGGAILCTKGDTNQGVFIDYGEFPKVYVDIGSAPTNLKNASWVRVMKVEQGVGFLLVNSQKTLHCDSHFDKTKKTQKKTTDQNSEPVCKGRKIIERYKVYRYMEDDGYEEWLSDDIPEKEWRVAEIDHKFSKKPRFRYTNCRYHWFAGFYKFLSMLRRY